MKIAIVLPAFKTGDTADISNYCTISALPCFSKILEHVMYNRLYKYLTDQKILHPQQFGFRKDHSAFRSGLRIIWERQLQRCYFCWLVKGVWYSRSYISPLFLKYLNNLLSASNLLITIMFADDPNPFLNPKV